MYNSFSNLVKMACTSSKKDVCDVVVCSGHKQPCRCVLRCMEKVKRREKNERKVKTSDGKAKGETEQQTTFSFLFSSVY